MNRREWLKHAAGVGAFAYLSPLAAACQTRIPQTGATAKVAFIKTSDRVKGIGQALDLLGFKAGKKDWFIKPNFNSADETPGSTHIDTLSAIVAKLRANGAQKLTIGDRSGMGVTNDVFENKQVFRLARESKVDTLVFDDLKYEDWSLVKFEGSHWKQGFYIPNRVKNADGLIQTCCLKTHRFGGHFTLSLKNSVGIAAKRVPGIDHNFMTELHSSADQRRMIAEINSAYKPDLIIMDGIDAFTTGGPDKGKQVNSQVILASADRIAIDAVGVAILRHFGTTEEVSKGKIFDQEQIARAAQLNIGISSPGQIELVTNDPESAKFAKEIKAVLNA